VTPEELRPAQFLAVPIDLYLDMQMHNDAVGRDLMLAIDAGSVPEIAARIRGLLGEGYERLMESRESMRTQVEAARSAGKTHVDLTSSYRIDDVVVALDYFALVEEADALAARGIIFVPNPGAEVARFRRWMMDELDAQVRGGRPPTPFPG
jgi:hypothetical protein